MKKSLLLTTTLATLVALTAAPDAQAQQAGYQAKDADARILGQRQYTPETQRVAEYEEAEQVRVIEPAAGARRDASSFTGFYAGASVGYNIGAYDVDNPDGANGDVGLDGFEGGLFVGYGMAQRGAMALAPYVGVEIGHDWSDASGSIDGTGYKKKREWHATLRPGAVFDNNTLGYGVIGYSRGKFEADGSSDNLHGLILGAGAEFGAGMPVKLRVEYNYTNYRDRRVGGIELDGHENEIKLGAVLRF